MKTTKHLGNLVRWIALIGHKKHNATVIKLPIVVILLFGITGCSCFATCDCFDEVDASINIVFNTKSESAKSWTQSMLVGTYLQQVDSNNSIITIDIISAEDTFPGRTSLGLIIPNSEALRTEAVYTSRYSYRIVNDSAGIQIVIEAIAIKGNLSNSLCCKCYTNEYVSFTIDGKPQTIYPSKTEAGASYFIERP